MTKVEAVNRAAAVVALAMGATVAETVGAAAEIATGDNL
jgi:hypothetical protein